MPAPTLDAGADVRCRRPVPTLDAAADARCQCRRPWCRRRRPMPMLAPDAVPTPDVDVDVDARCRRPMSTPDADNIKGNLEIKPVKWIDAVLQVALTHQPTPTAVAAKEEKPVRRGARRGSKDTVPAH
jgi:hypothetical protein